MSMDSKAPLDRVVLRGVTKRFGRQLALARLDLTIRRSEITVIMGDNGAGKSTLVNILSTALRPDEGDLRFEAEKHPLTLRQLRQRHRSREHIAVGIEGFEVRDPAGQGGAAVVLPAGNPDVVFPVVRLTVPIAAGFVVHDEGEEGRGRSAPQDVQLIEL